MTDLHKKNPEKLKQFQESVYFMIKYDCEKTTKDKHLDIDVNIDPRILTIQNDLKGFDERIVSLDNELKVMTETHRKKMKELKNMLRSGELNQLETFVVKDAIQLTQEKYKNNRKTRKKEIAKDKKVLMKSKQEMNKELAKTRRLIKQDLKEDKKEENAEEKDIQRAEKKLNKALRKQGNIREEFKEGLLKEMVDTYIKKTKRSKNKKEKNAKKRKNKKKKKQRSKKKRMKKRRRIAKKKIEKRRKREIKI